MIHIRKASLNDYQPLLSLFEEIDAYHRAHLPALFQKPNGPAREYDYFAELIADEGVGFFVAESATQLLGFAYAMIRDTPDIPILIPRRFAVVDTVVVRSAHQRQGIGKMLMNSIQTWALAKGATSIELTVYEFNQGAIAFYESLDYQSLHRRMTKSLDGDNMEYLGKAE